MFAKTKTLAAAAFVIASASAAFAQASGDDLANSNYLRNPAAPVPLYAQAQVQPYAGVLIEGRNVAIQPVPRTTFQSSPVAGPTLESFGGY
jgi:hypothetical protein